MNGSGKLFLAFLLLAVVWLPSLVLATEITGTLSVNPSTTPVDYRPNSDNLQFTVIDGSASQNTWWNWELPGMVKIILVAGVIVEILVLFYLTFFRESSE